VRFHKYISVGKSDYGKVKFDSLGLKKKIRIIPRNIRIIILRLKKLRCSLQMVQKRKKYQALTYHLDSNNFER